MLARALRRVLVEDAGLARGRRRRRRRRVRKVGT